jgi:hypothetical protein
MKSKLYGDCRWAVTVGYDPFIFYLLIKNKNISNTYYLNEESINLQI